MKRACLTAAQFDARIAILLELWPKQMHVNDIVDRVNADGLMPRWGERPCRKHANARGARRPVREFGGPNEGTWQSPDMIRRASARFAAAFRVGGAP